jgi:Alternative oxidase
VQGVFFNGYLLCYIISPRTCHSFVGYLEEEAVKTYTCAINDIDQGRLPGWSNREAPEIAKKYWQLQVQTEHIEDVCLCSIVQRAPGMAGPHYRK